MNAAYDQHPADHDRLRHCWLNERRFRFLVERLSSQPSVRARNVLEIGSGTGWLLGRLGREFPDLSFWGVEPLPEYVEYARQANRAAPNVTFLTGAAEAIASLPLPRPDVILSNDVLHHVARLDLAVPSISRIAAANCVWHSIEPNCLNIYSLLRQSITPGERVFWPGRFAPLAEKYQWRRSEAAYLFLVPPFVKDAPEWSKVLERKIEWVPFLGGGVYQKFERDGTADRAPDSN